MVSSKLNKFYLISPESFNKLTRPSEKEKKNIKRKERKKNIDYFKTLKNLQRKNFKPKISEKQNKASAINKNMEQLLTGLVSHFKTNKNSNESVTDAKIKEFVDMGIKSNSNSNRDYENERDKKSNFATQTEKYGEREFGTQTDWDQGERDAELADIFNKNVSFMNSIEEENENEQWTEDDDIKEVTVVEKMQTTPARNTPTRLFTKNNRKLFTSPMHTTPAKAVQSENPRFFFSGKKVYKPHPPKRFASPLVQKLNKFKIVDGKAVPISTLPKTPSAHAEAKRRKKLIAIEELRKSKITGSRKAKTKAMEKLKATIKDWKHI